MNGGIYLMAIRKIVKEGDTVLRSICKPVEVFDEKLHQLLDDMQETLKKQKVLVLPHLRWDIAGDFL